MSSSALKILFVVNDRASMKPDQTTVDLVIEAHRQGYDVWVAGDDSFDLTATGITVWAWPWAGSLSALQAAVPPAQHASGSFDGVWMRTNPGRAARSHDALHQLLRQVSTNVMVCNAPDALMFAASKLFLGHLPADTVPMTWSSTDAQRLMNYRALLDGQAVIKPALGTRGEGVVRLAQDERGQQLLPTLNAALAQGPLLLQEYLPDAHKGDTRIHVVAGRILTVEGKPCAVHRLPGDNEWRSNIALGGRAVAPSLTERDYAVVDRVGPILRDLGLWHVGLDVMSSKIVECNVFSPGGLADAGQFADVDFVPALVERFVEKVQNRSS